MLNDRYIEEVSARAVVGLKDNLRISVLYVEDERLASKVVKELLELQGQFDVDTVYSVQDAYERLKQGQYDVIVSDYLLPEEDGLQFLKKLRESGNSIPFILFTGKGREEVAIKALNRGADQYIDKHGDPETVYYELAHAIRQAVDRKSTQIELLKRGAKLNAILESSPEAITVTDLNGTIVECNQAAVDMHGFESKKELIGKNALGLIAKKDREKAIQNLKRTLEQGVVKAVEYTFLAKDGREFLWELSASIVRDASGKPELFVAITRDITERKKAEEKINLLSSVVQQALEGIAVSDVDGRILFANSAWLKMHGFDEDEEKDLVGKQVGRFYCRQQVECIDRKVQSEGIFRGRTMQVRKDGTTFPALTTLSLLRDENNQIMGIIRWTKNLTEIVRDIRDAKPPDVCPSKKSGTEGA